MGTSIGMELTRCEKLRELSTVQVLTFCLSRTDGLGYCTISGSQQHGDPCSFPFLRNVPWVNCWDIFFVKSSNLSD